MKVIKNLFVFVLIICFGCEKDAVPEGEKDGFCIVFNNDVVLNYNDFEYYDYSSHFLYFKNENPYLNYLENIGNFEVYADGEKIYEGMIVPENRDDLLYTGPILQNNLNYGDYILPVNSYPKVNQNGELEPDIREDERIVKALKEHNQYHSGLNCIIKSVQFSGTKAVLELTLSNEDSFDYYYLNPDSMGTSLFHYYSGNLFIGSLTYSADSIGYGNGLPGYSGHVEAESPFYWNYWDRQWLSLIKSGETKNIKISYNDFPYVTAGNYYAYFNFPGLNVKLSKDEMNLEGGKIWQGEIKMFKTITVE